MTGLVEAQQATGRDVALSLGRVLAVLQGVVWIVLLSHGGWGMLIGPPAVAAGIAAGLTPLFSRFAAAGVLLVPAVVLADLRLLLDQFAPTHEWVVALLLAAPAFAAGALLLASAIEPAGRRGWAGRLGAVGGALAIAVSAVLVAVVLLRDAVNPATAWTILLGAAGGVLALRRPACRVLAVAIGLVVLAALPAVIGGVGYLYVPALLLMAFAALGPRVLRIAGELADR